MNRKFQLFAAIVLVWALVPVGAVVAADQQSLATKPAEEKKAETRQVAVFRIHGKLREAPMDSGFGWMPDMPLSLHDLLNSFKTARKDNDLKAVVLTFEQPIFGWGQMQELRQAIRDMREAGKEVHCYLEEVNAATYMLASAASRVSIVPTGHVNLVGLSVTQVYFKQLMDKVGIQADVLQMGDYKTAGEPFTRTQPSPEAREMIGWLVDDLYAQMIETVADARGVSQDKVKELIDRGPFNAQQALEAGLVDEIAHAGEFVGGLRKQYGQQLVFEHNYGRDEGPDFDFSNPFSFFASIGKMMKKQEAKAKPTIAVIYAGGVIHTGKTEENIFGERNTIGSTTYRRALTKACDAENIKAVVLRVNSPGGSATASEVIWHAARQLQDKKPLIISMGNLAASGGYYVAAGGQTIFANPGTITGSIGVFGGKLVTKGLWDWAGLSFYQTSRGENANLFSTMQPFTEQQREKIRGQLHHVYKVFKDRVSRGRGVRLVEDLEEIAGGRVYTGRQAKKLGLVDRLGGVEQAVAYAAEQVELEKYDVEVLPKRKNFFEMLFRGSREEDTDHLDGPAIEFNLLRMAGDSQLQKLLPWLKRLDPQQAEILVRTLMRIDLLGRESILAVLPAELIIQ